MNPLLLPSGDEQLEIGRKLKCIRFVNGEPRCSKCNQPIAWIVRDWPEFHVRYVPSTTPDARPLTTCAAHREIDSGRINYRHATTETEEPDYDRRFP
jgi:hypothetical protein